MVSRCLHEGLRVKMIGQQGLHAGPLQRILAAGAVQKGGAFLRGVLLQRFEEDLLFRTAPGCAWIAHSMSCHLSVAELAGKTRQLL